MIDVIDLDVHDGDHHNGDVHPDPNQLQFVVDLTGDVAEVTNLDVGHHDADYDDVINVSEVTEVSA